MFNKIAKNNKGKTSNKSSRKLKDTCKSQNFQKHKEQVDRVRISNHLKHIIASRSNDLLKSGNAFLTIASRNEQIMTAKGFITGKKDDNVLGNYTLVSDDRSYAYVVKNYMY